VRFPPCAESRRVCGGYRTRSQSGDDYLRLVRRNWRASLRLRKMRFGLVLGGGGASAGLAALHPRKGPWWGQGDGGSGGPGLAHPGQHPTALQRPKPAGRANPRRQCARLGDRRLLLEAD